MCNSPGDYVGFEALAQYADVRPVQPLTSTCRIGATRATQECNGFRTEVFTAAYAPSATVRGHFEFGLKYDDLHLEWLARFFEAADPSWIVEWVREIPRSVYARRTGFLYEWLTGQQLPVPDCPAVTYEAALDDRKYLARPDGTRNRRWKIVDNMPGSREFCPMVRLTPDVLAALGFDLRAELARLEGQFGSDLLLRSAAWLTFSEARASFIIEKEADRVNDIRRFAAAMAAYCGRMDDTLSGESLVVLQREVLGDRALRTGMRKSPVFVGTATYHGATIVRYIAPDFELVPKLMDGLRAFERNTRGCLPHLPGAGPVARAAALSFGFVYIHPLSDGNGRVHRFLLNDTLMRDGLLPLATILPISSTIISSNTNRGDYEKVLEGFSAPLIRRYATQYRFGKERVYEDGVVTDFEFLASADAYFAWRYIDLTQHVQYMARIIRQTLVENMPEEARFFIRHDTARTRLKRVFEMPDRDADAIVRSLRDNKGTVSNKLRERYARIFDDPQVAAEALEAVMSGLEDRKPADFDSASPI